MGGFAHFLRIFLQNIRQVIDTARSYSSARWWGVDIGKGCTFIGKTYFRRTPNGSIKVGQNCRFLSTFTSNLHGLNRPCMLTTLRYGSEIILGDNVGLSGCVVAAATKVEIRDRVFCGANTTITDTDSHSLDYRYRHPEKYFKDDPGRVEPVNAKPIVIESDVFIGMNVLVLKGVTIGKGTVVGAGSIVANDLPPYVIAAGQPAKPIASLLDTFPDIID